MQILLKPDVQGGREWTPLLRRDGVPFYRRHKLLNICSNRGRRDCSRSQLSLPNLVQKRNRHLLLPRTASDLDQSSIFGFRATQDTSSHIRSAGLWNSHDHSFSSVARLIVRRL
jgi:hypothetical protein